MNSNKTKNILLSCGIILFITCVCLALIVVSGVGVLSFWPLDFNPDGAAVLPGETVTLAPSESPEQPTQPGITQPAPTSDVDPLPDEVVVTLLDIEGQVSELRGLRPQKDVPKIVMSPEALEDMVVNEFFADYTDEDARQDVLILSLLGLLPADFDIKNFYNALYSEQISGFYDSETEEIYVVSGVNFGIQEKMTYAHEFVHVLQDQSFGFEEGLNYNEEACEVDSERCAAIQALIEGDASWTELLWFQTNATRSDYLDLLDIFEGFDSPVFDNAPPYIQLDILFPYESGYSFVEYLYNQGGYAAVDAAYVDPPLSTEQILHPDRYPDDVPQTVVLPDLTDALGANWALYDQNVMGEWFIYLILGHAYDETYQLDESQSRAAAEGWGGDAYAFYLHEDTDELIFILDIVWDTRLDADEFMIALASYAGLRWDASPQLIGGQPSWVGVDQSVVLLQDGDRTVWIITPTASLTESVVEALQ
ncbi:MAG: hypothetical protein ACNA70_08800 [Brevefilum sp.]